MRSNGGDDTDDPRERFEWWWEALIGHLSGNCKLIDAEREEFVAEVLKELGVPKRPPPPKGRRFPGLTFARRIIRAIESQLLVGSALAVRQRVAAERGKDPQSLGLQQLVYGALFNELHEHAGQAWRTDKNVYAKMQHCGDLDQVRDEVFDLWWERVIRGDEPPRLPQLPQLPSLSMVISFSC